MGAFIAKHEIVAVYGKDAVKTVFFCCAKVCFEFGNADGAVAMNQVNAVIVIKEQGGVVEEALNVTFFSMGLPDGWR